MPLQPNRKTSVEEGRLEAAHRAVATAYRSRTTVLSEITTPHIASPDVHVDP
jgi:hypothetical protein